MRKVAPMAVMRTYNNRYFFSNRVDPKQPRLPGDLPGLEHPRAGAQVMRRYSLSVSMLVSGLALVIASFANATSPAQLRKGGIFRVGTTGASVQVDPQLAYITTAWWLEYATAAKLYNYPDRNGPSGSVLVPEVASRFTVSNGGRTYTFFIRKGFRFSDGEPVTARSFKRAINRVANKDLNSPGGGVHPHRSVPKLGRNGHRRGEGCARRHRERR